MTQQTYKINKIPSNIQFWAASGNALCTYGVLYKRETMQTIFTSVGSTERVTFDCDAPYVVTFLTKEKDQR